MSEADPSVSAALPCSSGLHVTVRRDGQDLADDPFARLAHAERLEVGPGLFGRVPPVPGPVIQRYAGAPWQAAGFPAL